MIGDPHTPPDDAWVNTVCKPGTSECCRYLTMSPTGWSCERFTGLKLLLDARVAGGLMNATGDNCPGRASR